MIPRYTLPEMAEIWTEENKFRMWLEVELLACEAWSELGVIPPEDVRALRQNARFDVRRIAEIERETRHDVVAFTRAVSESLGPERKWVHYGLTSTDVVDTALSALLKQANERILPEVHRLIETLAQLAKKHKYTVMMGRTHGVHAEPITFGLKMALWVMEVDRHIERLHQAREMISVGKISGAVGTFANVDPRVEEYVCRKLGLKPARVSTQIIQRDRHAQYLTTLAIIASSLEKMATEIRNLQRTDILEVEEPFTQGQKGSSAMPHKRNPIMCERIAGLARIIRGNALAALENIPLWHERDLTHSSVERVIIPDSTILLDYMLAKFTEVMAGLSVYPENMRRNLEATHGLVFSQRVLLALVEKGLLREEAYALVQRHAMEAWRKGVSFKELLLKDPEIISRLSPSEIEELFDYNYHLKYVDYIFERAGLK